MIPLHAGGPDKPFNLILLTVEEHITAHQLLFDAYGSFYDLGAVNMLTGLFKIGEANIRKANQEKMKKEKKGFFDKTLQAELARRPKKQRKNYARNKFIKAALRKGFALEHILTKDVITIKPKECSSVAAVCEIYLQHPTMVDRRVLWYASTIKERSQSTPSAALTRVLSGKVGESQKRYYTFLDFRVIGINIS